MKPDIIIGIDAGTSVVKAIAFSLDGHQLADSSVKNSYTVTSNGAAVQSMSTTWSDCVTAICGLVEKVENLATRTVSIGVTGQGDGTWLIDSSAQPITEAWLWLDARAAKTVEHLVKSNLEDERFRLTGTGLNTCQQGPQLAHMLKHYPDLIGAGTKALHCKDWLYYNLTGIVATDPSEASLSFGNFRTRQYDDTVIASLGLSKHKHLFPEILDGVETTHGLSQKAAALTGLLEGTPVSLGFIDMIMSALGAGVYTGEDGVACSAIGSTGVHMVAKNAKDIILNHDATGNNSGYVLCLPCKDIVAQMQSNMAASLNIDWILEVGADLIGDFTQRPNSTQMIEKLDTWLTATQPGQLLYHPYISEAGERGPFVNANASASFIGLNSNHKFPELVRAIVEGLAMAARDCYTAIAPLPKELRISGGAARSNTLREIFSASLGCPIRVSKRDEAGAAGCAMMAAVSAGVYPNMEDCIDEWVVPQLDEPEQADISLSKEYDQMFCAYQEARINLKSTWNLLDEKPNN